MKTHIVQLEDHGIFADHDMPCAVCWANPAVLEINSGIFNPCWECQGRGWQLLKSRRIHRFLRWARRG